MTKLLLLFFLSGVLLIVALIFLLVGLRKKNRFIMLASVILFFTSIGMGSWMALLTGSKVYNRVSSRFEGRTGIEIYHALFGTSHECVNILQFKDQVVPKLDDAIYLHAETCPKELAYIFQLNNYEIEVVSSNDLQVETNLDWFKPQELGDSVIIAKSTIIEMKNWQTIYLKTDSTEAFIRDIYD